LVILGTSTEFKIHQVIVNKNFATDLDWKPNLVIIVYNRVAIEVIIKD
jgi:hypothetical protein